ncbi:MAG: hypothetical protein JOY54_10615 [Acidobacteriaceae bacterium]|nr:hypothetical protein [Acidobacteriaceae bacterium]
MAKQAAVLLLDERWKTASKLHVLHEEPKFAPLQAPGLKGVFTKGVLRGGITEIHGRRSSGRMSACLHILAQATIRGEICAVVDWNDSFHPASAAAAGVRLESIVWVRCKGNAEHAIRAADLILHAGGFGVVLLDLCEAPARVLNRIPLSYWFRFRRAVESTPTILLLCADSAQAKSCASSNIQTKSKAFHWSGTAPFLLLRGREIHAFQQKVATIRPEPLWVVA